MYVWNNRDHITDPCSTWAELVLAQLLHHSEPLFAFCSHGNLWSLCMLIFPNLSSKAQCGMESKALQKLKNYLPASRWLRKTLFVGNQAVTVDLPIWNAHWELASRLLVWRWWSMNPCICHSRVWLNTEGKLACNYWACVIVRFGDQGYMSQLPSFGEMATWSG